MNDIIWKVPWVLYREYKEVREEIRNLPNYQELKTREYLLLKSLFVVMLATLALVVVIVFLAIV